METTRDSARRLWTNPSAEPGRVSTGSRTAGSADAQAAGAPPGVAAPATSERGSDSPMNVVREVRARSSAPLVGAAVTGGGAATAGAALALNGPWQAVLAIVIASTMISAGFSFTYVLLDYFERRRLADQRHVEVVVRLRLESTIRRRQQDIRIGLARQNFALQGALIEKIASESRMADASKVLIAVRGDRPVVDCECSAVCLDATHSCSST